MLKKLAISAITALGYDIRSIHQCGINFKLGDVVATSTLLQLASSISNIPGTFVECGVGRGVSLMVLLSMIKANQPQRKLWGFDSFEGFPEPSREDVVEKFGEDFDFAKRGPITNNLKFIKKGRVANTSPEFIRAALLNSGFDEKFLDSNLKLVKGFFDQSLSRYDGSPIAFLHIDVDLYQSYKDVLTSLFPLVAPGGVVLFNEYLTLRFPGAKKAIDEYLGLAASELMTDKVSGQAYIIKSRDAA